MYRLGMDLGGTKIEGVILDDAGETLFRERIGTEQEGGYKHILNRISLLYRKMADEICNEEHSFGIGTPGALSRVNNTLKNSNTLCLNGKPILDDLQLLLERPLKIENDANCFALAEAVYGAGAGFETIFGVIMGTGCGGGIVINNKIHSGLMHVGGEWGHHSLDPQGPLCYCGKKGCVEKYISGGGLSDIALAKTDKKESAKEIIEAGKKGIEPYAGILDDFLENFGRALGNLISILDPHCIVLGGGLSNVDLLYTEGKERAARYVFSDEMATEILPNRLGDSAGVIGAAVMGI